MPPQCVTQVQNYDYFSITGGTIVINTLTCTLIIRYCDCRVPLVWERTSPPLEGLGEASLSHTYLSVIQIVIMVVAELVTPVPRKTIVF